MTPRRDLDRCPSCSVHLTPQRVSAHRCPFCSADLRLASRLEPRSAVQRALRAGRSGLLAASLFSMTTLSSNACSDDEPEPTPDASDAADADTSTTGGDTGTSDLATDVPSDTAAPDTAVQPPYGIPPDDTGDDADAPDTSDDTLDTAPQPAYGIPADAE